MDFPPQLLIIQKRKQWNPSCDGVYLGNDVAAITIAIHHLCIATTNGPIAIPVY